MLILEHPKIDVNKALTSGGDNPLLRASELGYSEIVKLLVGHPDILVNKERIGSGVTSLWIASHAGSSAGKINFYL